jgi:hypothetical protein
MPPSNPPPNQNNDTRVRSKRPIRRGPSSAQLNDQVERDRIRLIDENMAKGAFSKRSDALNEAEIAMGLDPKTMLPFYGHQKDRWSDLKAGALDALYGTAATGAGMLGSVPSPAQEKFKLQRDILKNRQKILRQYLASSNEEAVTPGSSISKAAEISGELLNPAGKAKYLNAAWHGMRGLSDQDRLSDAAVAAGSNLAGEAIESSATGILKKKFPAAAAYLSKLPFFKKLAGLPGNVVGGTVLEPAANNFLDEYIRSKATEQNLSEYEIRELRERMMRSLGQEE